MSSVPTMFYAYPSAPPAIAETIEHAIDEINQGEVVRVKGWKALSNVGKVMIQEITDAIDIADLFGCDLSSLNFNVLFELGYAIGKERRIWISVSEVIDPEKRGARRIEPLLPIGHSRYVNTAQLVSKFYTDKPWADLESPVTLIVDTANPVRRRGASLLYLKSALPTDSSITASQLLDSSKTFGERIVDDPAEVPHESLEWYVQKVRRADAVVVHLLSNDSDTTEAHNAKCSLVAGLAYGMGRPLLMLAHGPFRTPLDFETLLHVHNTAAECKSLLSRWLLQHESAITERYRELRQFDFTRRASGVLARLSVGEIVAENEIQLIDEYFVETGAFRQAVSGNQSIFVGRKGTGKTANFYAVASELRSDPRNHVCVVKPISYELDGVLNLLRQTIDRAERGYLVESLWKFLLYTELAKSVTNELAQRPAYYQASEGERQLAAYVQEQSELIDPPFSERLQSVVDHLSELRPITTSIENRARISALLHDQVLSRLRALLGAALQDRKQVAILVDNLDKVWGERSETEILSHLLFGLLGVTGRIAEEFKSGNPRRPSANVSLSVFLRSDIFAVIQDIAREPDKISFERITWDDPEVLMRVVDYRLAYSSGEGGPPFTIWSKYFTPTVLGCETRSFIGKYVIPRPRDAIYLVREAISRAVNRGHTMVQADDILAAAQDYSQYAFDALLVEDDPRMGNLEAILYAFAGSAPIVSMEDVDKYMAYAGVNDELRIRYLDLLLDTNFLGIPDGKGTFEYPIHESRRRTAQRIAKQIAQRSGQIQQFEVNKVFRPVLQIPE